MQRIDLVCKVAAPAFLGFVLQVTPLFYALVGIAVWNVSSVIPELLLLLSIVSNHKELREKPQLEPLVPTDGEVDEPLHLEEESKPVNRPFLVNLRELLISTVAGWSIYARHRVFFASMAYVMLYCTVLAPGGLFNAYLKVNGTEDWMLGTMTGIAALIGLSATYVQPVITKRMGSRITGIALLWTQCLILLPVIVLLYYPHPATPFALMGLVALARFPLWGFDLVERHIMQTSIEVEHRGTISSVESAMTNVATLLIYVVSIVFPDPSQFIYLAIFSCLAIIMASLSFTFWSSRIAVGSFGPFRRERVEEAI